MEPHRETLDPADVGLARASELPFSFTPARVLSPLVVSLPHVGLEWPSTLGPRPQVNFARNADYGVDSLFSAAADLGAAVLTARFSRLVVDLNRAPDDVSATLVPDHPAPRPRARAGSRHRSAAPRGVIWTTALGNIPLLRSTISYAALSERLDRYYHPYYAALALLLERRRRDLGHAVVLDAHSMPSSVPGDLILGTLGGSTCSPALKAAALDALSEPGSDGAELEIKLDEPYRGGEVVRRFGRPAEALHALQLEVSRDLYMDEHRLELWSHSPRTAHPRRPLLAATRNRVVCLMGALAGARPESQ